MTAEMLDRPDLRVRAAYERCLSREGGFLPDVVPLERLHEAFADHQQACDSLASCYHGPDKSVRAALDARFGQVEPAMVALIDEMDRPELDKAMTLLSLLGHAYRWDHMPPSAEAYHLQQITLPPGIAEPWQRVANRLGLPRVGTLYHLLLNNWRLKGARGQGGHRYLNHQIHRDHIEIAQLWLRPPQDQELAAFLMTVIETEARGATALKTAVDLLSSAHRRDLHATTFLLDRFNAELQEVGQVFATLIRKACMAPGSFMTLIQPTFIWLLDEGDGHGPLEGASGPQVGCLQAFDAVLGIASSSELAQMIRRSRAYMPPAHREFLEVIEADGGGLRRYIESAGDRALTERYNACVIERQRWRRSHQKRGAMYLKGAEGVDVAGYTSTGLVVSLKDDRVAVFEKAMEQRLDETTGALFELEGPFAPATLEYALRYLTEADRIELLDRVQPRRFAANETILPYRARREGIFIVRRGTVRVVKGEDAIIAHLGEGEVFGEISFLDSEGASSAVIAATDCDIDQIEASTLFEVFAKKPELAGRFYQSIALFLSQRLRDTTGLLSQLLADEAPIGRRLPQRHTGHVDATPLDNSIEHSLSDFEQRLAAADRRLGTLADEDAVFPEVANACSELVALLTTLAAASRQGAADVVFRRSFRWLMQSAAIDLAYSQWSGDADEALLLSLRQMEPAGDSPIGRLIDRWFRQLPTMTTLRRFPAQLEHCVSELAEAQPDRPLQVVCLDVGSARALQPLLATNRIRLTCISLDATALNAARKQARQAGLEGRALYLHDNILRLAQGLRRDHLAGGSQDLIVSDLILNTLARDQWLAMINWAHARLRPGGAIIWNHIDPMRPDREFFERIIDWHPAARGREDLEHGFAESDFRGMDAGFEWPESAAGGLAMGRRAA